MSSPTFEDIRLSELINPTERQLQCIRVTDQHRYVLYGGGAGGGKSYLLRWWCLRQLIRRYEQTGIKGLVVGLFSKDYPTLQDRQLSKIEREFPDWLGKLKRTEKEGLCYFIHEEYGGGRIALRNLADPDSYKSAEFCDIAIEELSENKREVFESLALFRLRFSGIDRPCFLAATNPTGIGLQWIKKLWIDRKFPPELMHMQHEFAYVPALLADNPHLGGDYRETLRGLPEKKRKALLEGDWTVPEGQYFTNFEEHQRKVPAQIVSEIAQEWWPRWISMDWGFKHHALIYWHTIGRVMPEQAALLGRDWTEPRECIFTYRELPIKLADLDDEHQIFETGKKPADETELAQTIVKWSGKEKIKRFYLSPDAWAKKKSGNTPAEMIGDVLRKGGYPLPEPADNDREGGWRFMYSKIHHDQWFLSDRCPVALDAIPALEYDSDKGGEDVRKVDDIADDAADSLRYGLKSYLSPGKKPFAIEAQEKVQEAFQEHGRDAAMLVHLQMRAKQKGVKVWRRN